MGEQTPGRAAASGVERGGGDGCPCSGLRDPVELALCLAPPPGEYEVSLPAGPGTELVLDRERGLVLRASARDEFLPFLGTVERPASRVSLEAALKRAGMSVEELPRLSARRLLEAAAGGSRAAARLAERCRELVEALAGAEG